MFGNTISSDSTLEDTSEVINDGITHSTKLLYSSSLVPQTFGHMYDADTALFDETGSRFVDVAVLDHRRNGNGITGISELLESDTDVDDAVTTVFLSELPNASAGQIDSTVEPLAVGRGTVTISNIGNQAGNTEQSLIEITRNGETVSSYGSISNLNPHIREHVAAGNTYHGGEVWVTAMPTNTATVEAENGLHFMQVARDPPTDFFPENK